MKLQIPELSLVFFIGASGCGKSSFGRKHFLPTEVVSSDFCRGMVSDDENDQAATNEAFDLLHTIVRKRLARGKLTVIDATNVRSEDRKALLRIAAEYHVLPSAIVFALPELLCHERNASRPDRQFGPHVVRGQTREMRRSIPFLRKEGFRQIHILNSQSDVEAAEIERTRLWANRKDETGPFDIVGDVHGCFDELVELLGLLGYTISPGAQLSPVAAEEPQLSSVAEPEEPGSAGGTPAPQIPEYFKVATPPGRKLVFVGDLVDRGPKSPDVLKLAMSMVAAGRAICVPGNHDVKLQRYLHGRDVQIAHGLAETIAQLEVESPEFRKLVDRFIDGMVSHCVLDAGNLVVAHAGMKEEMQGRGSARVRDFALYGETTGETDEFGLPIRYNWAGEYRGHARVVYGHTPVPEAEWLNKTINIDTGCVFGGKLTALRYPEMELASVQAKQVYAESRKPFPVAGEGSLQQQYDDVLDLQDVIGKRIISTRFRHTITIREENAIAALEVISRFAANPKWLIYLPPTMSPCATSALPGYLEHPAEAFAYFQAEGVEKVICEEKHMGSRAVVVVCRDPSVSADRFGVREAEQGVIYTRTGRRFFDNQDLEQELIRRVGAAMERAGLWDELETDWVCLDCELMPWSVKAQELIRSQFAPVGASAIPATQAALAAASTANAEGIDEIRSALASRLVSAERYVTAYRQYCWPVEGIEDLKLAPFHLLASEGAVYADRDHGWHMATLARVCAEDPAVLLATRTMTIDTMDENQMLEGTNWWEEMTSAGGEGMVVKPYNFVASGAKGMVQPAVKCRGREYLRIIYGPEYDLPANLERLRKRGLGVKRSLAAREFALGIEGLERFVRKEPLRRVHECVFGVLAMESEPVDPRL